MGYILFIVILLFVLFVPGFFLSFVFFDFKILTKLERVLLSIALSMSLIPIIVFYGNLIGIKQTAVSVILQIVIFTSIVGAVISFQEFKSRRKKS